MLRNRNIILMTVLAVALGALLAGRTFAGGGGAAAPAGGKFWARISQKLDLTATQQTQMKAEFLAAREPLHAVLAQLHAARLGLRAAIHAPDASESSVRAAAAQVAAAEADFAVERLKLYRRINPILNPAQREQLAGLEQHLDEFVDAALARLGDAPVH